MVNTASCLQPQIQSLPPAISRIHRASAPPPGQCSWCCALHARGDKHLVPWLHLQLLPLYREPHLAADHRHQQAAPYWEDTIPEGWWPGRGGRHGLGNARCSCSAVPGPTPVSGSTGGSVHSQHGPAAAQLGHPPHLVLLVCEVCPLAPCTFRQHDARLNVSGLNQARGCC